MPLEKFGLFLSCLLCVGCGYVGPVLPPSPEIPNPVSNLRAVERGDQLIVDFSTPARTTDDLVIKRFSAVELRIGPTVVPFDLAAWLASAREYELSLPVLDDSEGPHTLPVSKSIPAAEWAGKRIAVLVRTSVKQNDHYSPWSNRAELDVVAPLETPAVHVKAVKQGYMLTWEAAEGAHYQILRQGPGQNAALEIGTADASPYLDETAQWDTRYSYTVIAQHGAAESLPSVPVAIIHRNTFPPAAPTGLAALAGPDSIELSWSRDTEPDLKGYYIYRSLAEAPWERIGDLTTVPNYSDSKVEHGKIYRYAVTAVNHNGYESEKSPIREVAF